MSPSVICRPFFMVGFKDVIGSWKIIPIYCTRTFSISFSVFLTISSPFIIMESHLNSAGGIDKRRIIDCTVTLFPDPDSPTIAHVSTSCKSKFATRTACTSPPYVWKDTDKFRSEEHTSELQSRFDLVCRLLLEKHNT